MVTHTGPHIRISRQVIDYVVRPDGFEPPTTWFEVVARNLVRIGNQQLRWPALVQIVAEPRGVPRKPYVFAGVCPDSTEGV